jgi:hypothetical protein
MTYEERLAAWAVVFPPEYDGLPNVDAEQFTALELALQELRETRQPSSNTARLLLVVGMAELLGALGGVEKAGA